MKKRYIAVLAALIMGISGLSVNTIVTASQDSEILEAESESECESESELLSSEEKSKIISLLIPEKVDIVIDPWEINRRGQIYSEEYVIRNGGETAGVLTLTNFIDTSQEQNGIMVRTDKTGLHQGQDKTIFLEMVLGNGDRVIFTQEGAAYEITLEPDEELKFMFAGEVNENTSCSWKDGDVTLRINYVWDMEEKTTAEDSGQNESAPADQEREEGQEPAEGSESAPGDGNTEEVKEPESTEGSESTLEDGNTEEVKEPEPAEGSESTPEDGNTEEVKEPEPAEESESAPEDADMGEVKNPAEKKENTDSQVPSDTGEDVMPDGQRQPDKETVAGEGQQSP